MQFHHRRRQRQPQAGAGVPGAHHVGDLAERRQRLGDILLAHADAIVRHRQGKAAVGQPQAGKPHLAAGGREFDGVAHQVDEDLAHHALHRQQADVAGRHRVDHRDIEFGGQAFDHGQRRLDGGQEVELLGAFQRHLARLDLGEVENVVDDAQQVAA